MAHVQDLTDDRVDEGMAGGTVVLILGAVVAARMRSRTVEHRGVG
jgi:hypothetical protein